MVRADLDGYVGLAISAGGGTVATWRGQAPTHQLVTIGIITGYSARATPGGPMATMAPSS